MLGDDKKPTENVEEPFQFRPAHGSDNAPHRPLAHRIAPGGDRRQYQRLFMRPGLITRSESLRGGLPHLGHESKELFSLSMPITDLCDRFPQDASSAYLAYAESQSFVRFIQDQYGPTYLHSLIDAYADGLSCAQGVPSALNTSLESLEASWRETVLGQNVMGVFFRNMFPYIGIFIFLLLIPMIGFLQRRPDDDDTS